jgi:hypothetical protein
MKKYIKPVAGVAGNEANDCCVRALANCTGYDYALALAVCKKAGFDPSFGMELSGIRPMLASHGFAPCDEYEGFTLDQFMASKPLGAYFCTVEGTKEGHAFCIQAGQLIDGFAINSDLIIDLCYRLRTEADY